MKTERAIELLHRLQDEQFDGIHGDERREALSMAVRALEPNLVQESGDLVQDLVKDCISRKMAIDQLHQSYNLLDAEQRLEDLPSAQPERYTKEELRVFQHGISLSLLSKRSAQHWQYDEDTATEIKFLERLYEKVGADMRGENE